MTDLRVYNEGSIFLISPESEAGGLWLQEHTADDAMWHVGSLVVEHRFVEDIVNGAIAEGLTVR